MEDKTQQHRDLIAAQLMQQYGAAGRPAMQRGGIGGRLTESQLGQAAAGHFPPLPPPTLPAAAAPPQQQAGPLFAPPPQFASPGQPGQPNPLFALPPEFGR